MKILYILGPTAMSGAAISFKSIFDGMIERNYKIIVLVSRQNKNREFIDYMISRGGKIEEFDDEAYIYPKWKLLSWNNSFVKYPLRLARKILQIIRSNDEVLNIVKRHAPDIVHTNVGIYRQGLYASKKLNIPHIWHIREYQTKDFGWKIFPSRSNYIKALESTNVICITEDILDYFRLQSIGSARAWWNGILSKSAACYKKDKKSYFLCANRISPEKKVEDAIQAFLAIAVMLPVDYKLLIVGDQHDRAYLNKLEKLVAESQHASRIEFRQHQPDVTKLMEDANALIVSSQFEGLGRMSLEATFKGCLVIGRATGGTKEILTFTEGGFLFNTVEELSKFMLHVANIKGSEMYEKIIERAQIKAVERCGYEGYNERLNELYNLLVN